MKLRFATAVLVASGVLGLASASHGAVILDGGLTESFACPDGASPCSTSADFTLDPPTPAKPATGTIGFGATTATITLDVASYSMAGSSGSVTGLDFTNVVYSAVVPITVTDLGGGIVQIDQDALAGLVTGSVAGDYAQTGFAGPAMFSDGSVSFSSLSCLLVNGEGQCGFQVGALAGSADFALSVEGNSGSHDVVQSFNVLVPEPGTGGLVALGLLGLALRRR